MPDYLEFGNHIKLKTGIDLSLYNVAQMKRRLTSFYDKKGFTSFTTLLDELHVNQLLFEEFLDYLTINVTEFYRNKKYWQEFERNILPFVKGNNGILKVWSAGCSSGEEVYTTALICANSIPSHEVSIIGTDLDQQVLDLAGQGIYPERSVVEVSEARKKILFERQGKLYRVKDRFRRMVTFKQHNLLNDAYLQNCDVIICRNVMIYFTDVAKHEIYKQFSKSICPGGVLFVGSTEQIFSPEIYGLEKIGSFFYRKK